MSHTHGSACGFLSHPRHAAADHLASHPGRHQTPTATPPTDSGRAMGRTLAPSGMPHALSRAPSPHPRSLSASHIAVKSGLHQSVGTPISAAGVYRANRGFRAEILDAIALIINYLGVPFGVCFTKQERVKKINATEMQRNNYPKNNKLQENIIYLEFSYKTKNNKNNKSVNGQSNFQRKILLLG